MYCVYLLPPSFTCTILLLRVEKFPLTIKLQLSNQKEEKNFIKAYFSTLSKKFSAFFVLNWSLLVKSSFFLFLFSSALILAKLKALLPCSRSVVVTWSLSRTSFRFYLCVCKQYAIISSVRFLMSRLLRFFSGEVLAWPCFKHYL